MKATMKAAMKNLGSPRTMLTAMTASFAELRRRPIGTATKVLLAAVGAATVLGVTMAALPNPIPPGAATLQPQVTATSAGSPNSTTTFTTGDNVQWNATYIEPQVLAPQWQDNQMDFAAGQLHVPGSTKVPSGYTAQYKVAGVWSAVEPSASTAIEGIKWKYSPTTAIESQPAAGSINFTGGGDGFGVDSFNGNLYLVNHHTSSNYIKCYSSVTGAVCPGWAGGKDVGGGATTSNIPLTHLNRSTGKLYFPVGFANGTNGGFGCFNLITSTSCGTIDMGTYGTGWWESVVGMGSVGDNIYAGIVDGGNKVWCLNTQTEQPCQATHPAGVYSFPAGWALQRTTPGAVSAPYLFIGGNCFNDTTGKQCAGAWPSATLHTGTYSNNNGKYRIITNPATGAFQAVCGANGSNLNCVNAAGATVTPPTGLSASYGGGLYSYQREATYKNRVYSFDNLDNILCFDLNTNAACPNFPVTVAAGSLPYTINIDGERENCLWTNGDSAQGFAFDAFTGGNCTSGPGGSKVTVNVTPLNSYLCVPSAAQITGWRAVVFGNVSWATAGLTAVKATITNATTGAALGTRSFANGKDDLDISDINYAANPSLKVEIQFTGTNTGNIQPFADVLWNGAPKQFCSTTKTTADCKVSASFMATAGVAGVAAAHDTQTVLDKSLQSSTAAVTSGYNIASAVSSLSLETAPLLFRGGFDLPSLTGDLTVARMGPLNPMPGSILVKASDSGVIPGHASRNVLTQYGTPSNTAEPVTIALSFDNLAASQKALINTSLTGAADTNGGDRINYLRGDKAKELPAGPLRKRTGPLGMVLDSGITYMPITGMSGFSNTVQPGYSDYALNTGRTKPVVFMNANDGMLHAFTVDDKGGTDVTLKEQFAYMPSSLLKRINQYTDGTASSVALNPYFNDNSPMVADIKRNGTWSTVLASAFGRGGTGLFVLDVTRADTITQSTQKVVIREFTSADDADMGKIITQPVLNDSNYTSQIVQVNDGGTRRPAVIVGNGVESTSNVAALFVIYLDSAGGYKKIVLTGAAAAGVANGLSTPRVLASTTPGVADRVYAGDLQGNVWAIDLSNTADIKSSLLFKAESTSPQPISSAPTAIPFQPFACANCWMVNVVTGKPTTGVLLLENNIPQQTAYGLFDLGAGATVLKTQLVPQVLDSVSGNAFVVKNRTINYGSTGTDPNRRGWSFDLPARQMTVANPFMRDNGTVVFYGINAPPANICGAEMTGQVWEVLSTNGNVSTGGLDINGDFKVDDADLLLMSTGGSTSSASGLGTGAAQMGNSQVASTKNSAVEHKILATGKVVTEGIGGGGGSGGPKRMGWREITP